MGRATVLEDVFVHGGREGCRASVVAGGAIVGVVILVLRNGISSRISLECPLRCVRLLTTFGSTSMLALGAFTVAIVKIFDVFFGVLLESNKLCGAVRTQKRRGMLPIYPSPGR